MAQIPSESIDIPLTGLGAFRESVANKSATQFAARRKEKEKVGEKKRKRRDDDDDDNEDDINVSRTPPEVEELRKDEETKE